jgi:hypothetical protein
MTHPAVTVMLLEYGFATTQHSESADVAPEGVPT